MHATVIRIRGASLQPDEGPARPREPERAARGRSPQHDRERHRARPSRGHQSSSEPQDGADFPARWQRECPCRARRPGRHAQRASREQRRPHRVRGHRSRRI